MPVNHQANKEVIIPAMVDSYLHKGFGLLLYNGNIEEYDKESACQCRRHGFYPWVMKIPWRRKWQNPLQYSCLGNPMDMGLQRVDLATTLISRKASEQFKSTSITIYLFYSDKGAWNREVNFKIAEA